MEHSLIKKHFKYTKISKRNNRQFAFNVNDSGIVEL